MKTIPTRLTNRSTRLPRTILAASAASLLAVIAAVPSANAGTLLYTGGLISENFDLLGTAGLTTTTLLGNPNNGTSPWFAGIAAAGTGGTTQAAFTTQALNAVSDGSVTVANAAARLFNNGQLGVNPLSDRALGSGNTGGDPVFDLSIRNDTANPLLAFTVSFDTEFWRGGDDNAVNFGYQLFYSPTGLASTWTAFTGTQVQRAATVGPADLDGNLPANLVAGTTRSLTLGTSIAVGQTFFLRFVDNNDATNSPDANIAIDNFTFTQSIPSVNLTYNLTHGLAGQPNGILEVSAAQYWLNGGGAGFNTNDNLIFSQPGTAIISVPNSVLAGTITVDPNTPTNFYTLDTAAGATLTAVSLNGTGPLAKSGPGTLAFTATGTATGGLTISGGTVSAPTSSGIGAITQNVTLKNNATLNFSGTAGAASVFNDATTTTRTITIGDGGGTIDITGTTGATGSGVTISKADSVVEDPLFPDFPITKTGGGVFRVAADQTTLSSNWIVNDGTLEARTNGAFGSGTVTVNPLGRLIAAGDVVGLVVPNDITLAGGALGTKSGDGATFGGTVNVMADSTLKGNSNSTPADARTFTISGKLEGSAGLTVTGATPLAANDLGIVVLSNTLNDYSGNVTVTSLQSLASAAAGGVGSALGTASITLAGGNLGVRDDGTGSAVTLPYGNNVTVVPGTDVNFPGVATVSVDRPATGVNTGNTVDFGSLSIGAQTLNVVGGNGYGARFSSATLTGAVGTSATLNTDGTALLEVAGAISGVAGLTKNGVGSLTLSGASTYTGPTSINDGTLILSGAGALPSTSRIDVNGTGTVLDVTVAASFTIGATQTLAGTGTVNGPTIVASGGKIEGGDALGNGTLTVGDLTLGGTATIRTTAGSNPNGSLDVTGLGGLTASGALGSVTVNVSGAQPTLGTHVLIDYTGVIGGPNGSGAFTLGTLPSRTAVLDNELKFDAVNSTIFIDVTGIDYPCWTGALSSTWRTGDLGATKNWVLASNNAIQTDYIESDKVFFDDIATNPVVAIDNGNVLPQEVIFDNKTKAYTLNGPDGIAGPVGITKNGNNLATSVVTINNNNSFTGPVTMNAGTVRVATVAANGVASPLGAGTSLGFDGGALEVTGAGTPTTNRLITMQANGGTIRNGAGSALTLSGVIDGIGGLTKSGDGTVILTGLNTYGGITTLAGGILNVGSAETVGVTGPLGNFGTILFRGGTLQYSAANANDYSGRFGTDPVDPSPAPSQSYNVDTNGQTVTWATDLISVNGTLTKSGLGTLTLGGAGSNVFGATTVSGGTLIAGKTDGVIAIPGNLVINTGGTFQYVGNNVSNQIADGAAVIIDGGTFGDPAAAVPTNAGATDKILSLSISNGGRFGSGRNIPIVATPTFEITDTLTVTDAGSFALAQRGGSITAGAVVIAGPGTVNLDGGSTTPGQQSQLRVLAGGAGLTLVGASINFNAGPSTVGATAVGSILTLNDDVTSTGTSSFVRVSPLTAVPAIVDLAAAVRTFDVTGTLTIAPDLGAATDLGAGGIFKTGTGKLVLEGAQNYASLTNNGGRTDVLKTIGNGSSTVTAMVGEINFAESQTLASLTIADGAIVTIGTPLPPAPAEAFAFEADAASAASAPAAVPEPGSAALLLGGIATLLGMRRRSVRVR